MLALSWARWAMKTTNAYEVCLNFTFNCWRLIFASFNCEHLNLASRAEFLKTSYLQIWVCRLIATLYVSTYQLKPHDGNLEIQHNVWDVSIMIRGSALTLKRQITQRNMLYLEIQGLNTDRRQVSVLQHCMRIYSLVFEHCYCEKMC